MKGVLASLTMMELRLANDLSNMFPSPYEGTEPTQPLAPHPGKMYTCAGVESDSDTYEEDSGEEWDAKEHGDWVCCPSLPLRMGPTWAEVHATAQEWEALDRKDLAWDDRMKHNDSEESDWDKDDATWVKCQFEDTSHTSINSRCGTAAPTEDPMDESPAETPRWSRRVRHKART